MPRLPDLSALAAQAAAPVAPDLLQIPLPTLVLAAFQFGVAELDRGACAVVVVPYNPAMQIGQNVIGEPAFMPTGQRYEMKLTPASRRDLARQLADVHADEAAEACPECGSQVDHKPWCETHYGDAAEPLPDAELARRLQSEVDAVFEPEA
jgi:hypothetical protein